MGKIKIHISLPDDTLDKLDVMTAEDAAKGAKPDRGLWLTALIEREHERREKAKAACPECDGERLPRRADMYGVRAVV